MPAAKGSARTPLGPIMPGIMAISLRWHVLTPLGPIEMHGMQCIECIAYNVMHGIQYLEYDALNAIHRIQCMQCNA